MLKVFVELILPFLLSKVDKPIQGVTSGELALTLVGLVMMWVLERCGPASCCPWQAESWPWEKRAEELPLSLAYPRVWAWDCLFCPLPATTEGRTGPTPSLGKAGELALVVQVQERGWVDKLSYHPDPDPGLWDCPFQHLLHPWTAGAQWCGWSWRPKLQDLHDTDKTGGSWCEKQNKNEKNTQLWIQLN